MLTSQRVQGMPPYAHRVPRAESQDKSKRVTITFFFVLQPVFNNGLSSPANPLCKFHLILTLRTQWPYHNTIFIVRYSLISALSSYACQMNEKQSFICIGPFVLTTILSNFNLFSQRALSNEQIFFDGRLQLQLLNQPIFDFNWEITLRIFLTRHFMLQWSETQIVYINATLLLITIAC